MTVSLQGEHVYSESRNHKRVKSARKPPICAARLRPASLDVALSTFPASTWPFSTPPATAESGGMSLNLRNVFHTAETITVDKYKEKCYCVQMSSLILNLLTQLFFHVLVTKAKFLKKSRMLLDISTQVDRSLRKRQ